MKVNFKFGSSNFPEQIDSGSVLFNTTSGILAIDLDKRYLLNAPVLKVTHSELMSLRENALLVTGRKYRITDYEFTTSESNTRSAGYKFDIIVEAINENTLSEQAYAAQHEGETRFDGIDLTTWTLWYDLEGSAERFSWGGADGCKGIIYRLQDHQYNDVPFDVYNLVYIKDEVEYYAWDTFSESPDWSQVYNNKWSSYRSGGKYCLPWIIFARICQDITIGERSHHIFVSSTTSGSVCSTLGMVENCEFELMQTSTIVRASNFSSSRMVYTIITFASNSTASNVSYSYINYMKGSQVVDIYNSNIMYLKDSQVGDIHYSLLKLIGNCTCGDIAYVSIGYVNELISGNIHSSNLKYVNKSSFYNYDGSPMSFETCEITTAEGVDLYGNEVNGTSELFRWNISLDYTTSSITTINLPAEYAHSGEGGSTFLENVGSNGGEWIIYQNSNSIDIADTGEGVDNVELTYLTVAPQTLSEEQKHQVQENIGINLNWIS